MNFFRHALFAFFLTTSFAFSSTVKEFWIWPPRTPLTLDKPEHTLYLLRGSIEKKHGRYAFIQQGRDYTNLRANVVLVYRIEDLPSVEFLAPLLEHEIKVWKKRNVNFRGIQFDYDSPSLKLPLYADFLTRVRSTLPIGLEVSITGLVDWLRSSPEKDLAALNASVSFIAFQLYTHGHVYPDLEGRLKDLSKIKFQYKTGILDDHTSNQVDKVISKNFHLSSIKFKGKY